MKKMMTLLLLGVGLVACNGAQRGAPPANNAAGGGTPSSLGSRSDLEYGGAEEVASCAAGANTEGGRAYQAIFPSRVDGEAISIEIHEPNSIDCAAKHPLILEGHGYAGSRTTGVGGFAALTGAGYTVISIDQRGSPDSGGTIRVMDPDFEGEDLVAIVDWAEQHLDYLRYAGGNLLLGSIGGSYGGMYQYLLLNKDPDRRLDAIVPEIAPHDLTYSLNPGGVVKSQWALVLAGAGDAQTNLGQDSIIRATLLEGGVTGEFPASALPFFAYHSMRYFCENPLDLQPGVEGDTAAYTLDPVLQLLPLTSNGEFAVLTPSNRSVPKVDALIWQGPRDDLFNLNEAYKNYQCLKRAGGDVRLLTYSFGHHFLTPNVGLALQVLNTQASPLNTNCGNINKDVATLAWFNEKLMGIGNADDVISTGSQVCVSLTEGDAVTLADLPIGGTEFAVELPGGFPVPVTIENPVPVVVPLTTAGGGSEVLAGIPTASLTLTKGDPVIDGFCQEETDPVLRLGTCDATVFAGIGVIRTGGGIEALPLVPDLLEEQVMPLNGLGSHEVELVGVAERISAGDQIVLLLYGLNDAFIVSSSRDVSTPVVFVSGSINLPAQGDLPNFAIE